MLIEKIIVLYEQLALDIEFKSQRIIEYANKKWSAGPLLEKGDKVYLLRKNIKIKRISNKLDFKKLGLFEVLEKIGSVNFRI